MREFAYTAADVRRIVKDGKLASMAGLEGGHQINGSLATLRMYYRLGCRYLTLTHNGGPGWADAALDENSKWNEHAKAGGLSAFGVEVVKEMNRLGMAVDLSHVHPDTMKKAIHVSEAPVIFSHSNTRAVCNHPRNVPDDVLRSLSEKDGVVMINVNAPFVAGDFFVSGGKVGASVIQVADHIDYAKKVCGNVALGPRRRLRRHQGAGPRHGGRVDVSCLDGGAVEARLQRRRDRRDPGAINGGNVLPGGCGRLEKIVKPAAGEARLQAWIIHVYGLGVGEASLMTRPGRWRGSSRIVAAASTRTVPPMPIGWTGRMGDTQCFAPPVGSYRLASSPVHPERRQKHSPGPASYAFDTPLDARVRPRGLRPAHNIPRTVRAAGQPIAGNELA